MAREFLGVSTGMWVIAIVGFLALGWVGTGLFQAVQKPQAADYTGDVTASNFFDSSGDEAHLSEANVRTVSSTDDTASMNGSYNFTGVGSERIVYYSADVSGLGNGLKLDLNENDANDQLTTDLKVVEHAFVDSSPSGFAYTVPSDATSGEYTHTVAQDIEDTELHFKDVWRASSFTGGITTSDLATVTISLDKGDTDNDQTTLSYEAAES